MAGIQPSNSHGSTPATMALITGEMNSSTQAPGIPDQNIITSSTAPNTSELPRSGCTSTSSQGKPMIAMGRSRSTGRSTGWRPSTRASSRIAPTLANSDGCTWKPPMLIQLWAPRALTPTTRTAIRLATIAP